jgi:sugar lactone lactonase YvrE
MIGLHFPNGVQLSNDDEQSFVYVAEMMKSRIIRCDNISEINTFLIVCRYYLTEDRHDVFVDNLPGYPDNIRLSANGTGLWVPLAGIRSIDDAFLAKYASIRNLLTKV